MNEIYIRYKHILSGCRTIYDALYFAQYIIKEYPESKKLINGMIHGRTYDKILDFRTMVNTLNIIENMETKQDINDYINKNIKENYDFIQTNAMMRITKTKKLFISDKNNDTEEKIYKLNNDIDNIININIDNIDNIDKLNNDIDNIDNIDKLNNDIDNIDNIDKLNNDIDNIDNIDNIDKLNNDIDNIDNIDKLNNDIDNIDNIDEKIILTNISNVDNPIENLEYIEFTSSDED